MRVFPSVQSNGKNWGRFDRNCELFLLPWQPMEGLQKKFRCSINEGRSLEILKPDYLMPIVKVILQGCEKQNAPGRELHMLLSFVNRCLRIMLSVFCLNTISNESLLRRTNKDTVINDVYQQMFTYNSKNFLFQHDFQRMPLAKYKSKGCY